MSQRKYQMTRLRAGSYLLPSNDAETLWHIYSFEDGRTYGLDEPDRTWWACARYRGTPEQAIRSVERDLDDYGYIIAANGWSEVATYLRTRAEAIDEALKSEVAAVR